MSAASNGHGGGGHRRSDNSSASTSSSSPPASIHRYQQQPSSSTTSSLPRHVSDQQTLAAARALAALPQTPVPPQRLFTQPQQQQQPMKIVSVVSKAPTVMNGNGAININDLLPTVPIPPSAINGKQQTVVVTTHSGQQQQVQPQPAPQPQRPRSCRAEVVTNSMKCLRQKGSSFLRSHASKHGITNASRKLTTQVLSELTLHYMHAHMIEMHLDDPNSTLTSSEAAAAITMATTASSTTTPAINGTRPIAAVSNPPQALQLVTPSNKQAPTTMPVPVVDAKGAMQTIQIQLQHQSTPAAAMGAPPQLSFLTPVAVLPQEPIAIVTPISAGPPGTLKVLPPPDPLAVSSTTTGGPVSMVVASSKSPTTLASILPKHPVPQSQLVVTTPAPSAPQGHSNHLAPSKSVPEQLAQLKPVAHVRPVPPKTSAVTAATIKQSPPNLPTQPVNTIILPSKPVAPAPPTPPSTTVVILNSNGAVVGNGTAAKNGHQPHSGVNGAATTPTASSNNNGSSGGQSCPSGVIAKTRSELSSCGTSMLRPEAAAHKVHNASRKPKETVIDELWQHYLVCHAAELASPESSSTTTATRAHPKKAVKTESPHVKEEDFSSATTTTAADSIPSPPKKRPRLTPPTQQPVQRTTIAHVAEVAAAAAEGWVGKVAEDDDDEANS